LLIIVGRQEENCGSKAESFEWVKTVIIGSISWEELRERILDSEDELHEPLSMPMEWRLLLEV
jgi:hypothetical protein